MSHTYGVTLMETIEFYAKQKLVTSETLTQIYNFITLRI